jgi:hypothetical protein
VRVDADARLAVGAPAALGQGAESYTQCHTYVGGDTVYTSKLVPHVGDARTWLAPFQAYITESSKPCE